MDIGNVLSRAWQIIWKYKILWVFGILASCSGASGGAGGSSRYSVSRTGTTPGMERFFEQIQQMPGWLLALLVAALVLLILLLIVLAIFFGTIGKIGLIRGTQQAEAGAEKLTFGELFRNSLPYFWRVFGLNLVVGLAIALFVFFVVMGAIFGTVATLGVGAICLVGLICLLVPFAWLVGILVEQANIAIVLENLGIRAAIRRGWEVFKSNPGILIVMGLILLIGIGWIGGLIISLPVFLVAVPALVGAVSNTRQVLWGGLVIAGLCLMIYLPVFILLNGILRAYIETAWTLTYMRLSAAPAPSLAVVEEASG